MLFHVLFKCFIDPAVCGVCHTWAVYLLRQFLGNCLATRDPSDSDPEPIAPRAPLTYGKLIYLGHFSQGLNMASAIPVACSPRTTLD